MFTLEFNYLKGTFQSRTTFHVTVSFPTEYLGCLPTRKTERLYMPGLHFHTGLYTPIVLRTQLFIIFSVVSFQLSSVQTTAQGEGSMTRRFEHS